MQICICKGLDVSLVPRTGLEPVHREVLVFETNASTNSAIWASDCRSYVNMKPPLVSLSVCKVNIFFLIGKIIEEKFYNDCIYFSASKAALHPVPAATTACLYVGSQTSPAANTPGITLPSWS